MMATTPQETGAANAEAQAAKSLEALTAAPLEFTGDFEKDIEIAHDFHRRFRQAMRDSGLKKEDREGIYQEAVGHLERQNCWQYRLTTEKGSRYFITNSGVVFRVQPVQEYPTLRIHEPTRLLGFATDRFFRAYARFYFAFTDDRTKHQAETDFRYRHDDRFITFSYVHGREVEDQTTLTLSHLYPEPRKGLRPIDLQHVESCKDIGLGTDKGAVTLTYAPSITPEIHPGHKIKKIVR